MSEPGGFADELEAEEQPAPPSPRTPASTKKKIVAGVLALLLVLTFASSLLGGTRDTSGTTTTTATAPTLPATTSTTADRAALVAAGEALAAALPPVPAGDVQFAGEGAGPADQNRPDAAVVDVVGVGWYDDAAGERYVFVRTRGGPPPDLAGCYSLDVTYTAAGATAAQGEINLGGPCASRGAFETGRKAGFLLSRGALWVLELESSPGAGTAEAGNVAVQLFVADDGTLADGTAAVLAAPPIPPDVAEALLPLLNFRPADPPDGPVAPAD